MKKIVDNGKDNNWSDVLIRNQLKEFLHYFVLDFYFIADSSVVTTGSTISSPNIGSLTIGYI